MAPNRSVAGSENRWNSEIFPQVKEVHFAAVQRVLDCIIAKDILFTGLVDTRSRFKYEALSLRSS